MTSYQPDPMYPLNSEYQVLAWYGYEVAEDEQLGSPDIESNHNTFESALEYFNKVEKYLCKMIMRYDSGEPDSDGHVEMEEWTLYV